MTDTHTPSRPKLSVYIITYNEADKIADAVASVTWADEVLVLDSNSSDDTAKIATELGATVKQIPFTTFGKLRNDAIAACSHDWVTPPIYYHWRSRASRWGSSSQHRRPS